MTPVTILDGRKIAKRRLAELSEKVKSLRQQNIIPRLVIVGVGDDQRFAVYAKQKIKRAQEIGLEAELVTYGDKYSTLELKKEIVRVTKDRRPHGLIVQLPLPEHLDSNQVLSAILPGMDVDGLTAINSGRLQKNSGFYFQPPTIAAIMDLMEAAKVNLQKDYLVLLGAGELVGKPLASVLLQQQATFSVLTANTASIADYTRQADVVIAGTGQPHVLKPGMIKEGAVIIDAGYGYRDGKSVGDVDYEAMIEANKPGAISPVPGGVGPLTVVNLLNNVFVAAKR